MIEFKDKLAPYNQKEPSTGKLTTICALAGEQTTANTLQNELNSSFLVQFASVEVVK